MQHGRHVSELQKLTALTSVHLLFYEGDADEFGESFQGLASVTQLREVVLALDEEDFSRGWLLPLTRLTALTRLQCMNYQDDMPWGLEAVSGMPHQ
jgi:hypothetical protein